MFSVEVNNLTKKFGEFTAVDRITLSVKRGEIFGFLGPNGSGKSTTIRMLCGILEPSSGTGKVEGLDVSRDSEKIKSVIGYMSQKFSLYNDLTVGENINFFAGIHEVSGERLSERKNWILEMAGLRGKEKLLTNILSGGWRQRLALGCALIHSPSVLFLDEPTAGVDPLSRRDFWRLIHETAEQGTTVFVTTHYMDEAEQCRRISLIYRGRLIAAGSPAELKNESGNRTLEELFVSRIREYSSE